jgi:hypothetical protein
MFRQENINFKFFLSTFMCSCRSGYTLAEDGLECIDDNERSLNNGHDPCQDVCTNTEGDYKCSDWKIILNFFLGTFMCNCQSGYTLAKDGLECIDDNECSLNNGHRPCQDVCTNTERGYKYSYRKILISKFFLGTFMFNCQSGYTLVEDGLDCIDDNVCSLNNGHGPCQDVCSNIEGCYKCSDRKMLISNFF